MHSFIDRKIFVTNMDWFNMFLLLQENPGPVRNLRCNYRQSRHIPLICEWDAPQQLNGQIQYYHVKIRHNNETIYSTTEKNPRWNSTLKLKNGDMYVVSISTVTYAVGPTVSTQIVFQLMGKL